MELCGCSGLLTWRRTDLWNCVVAVVYRHWGGGWRELTCGTVVTVLFRCGEELTCGTVWLQCCLDMWKN